MAQGKSVHVPVLVDELVDALDLQQSDTVIDATFGFGGHARRVLEHLGPTGRLVGFERDPDVCRRARRRFQGESRLELHRATYRDLEVHLEEDKWVDGVYFDLGMCSFHLESSGRGFSFRRHDEPLDCRFDPDSTAEPARELIARQEPQDLERLLREYGEVRQARAIVREIEKRQPIETVGELRACVEAIGLPPDVKRGELARVFQAFRIAVNDELDHLRRGLRAALEVLREHGRLAVIAYHSLEDRIVKQFFRHEAKACVCPPDFPVCACEKVQRCRVVTQSPVMPKEEETQTNPRARSARLRVAEAT